MKRACLLREDVGADLGGTSRARLIVGAFSGEGHGTKPRGFEDYDGECECLFHNFPFEKRLCRERTVGGHSLDICSFSADDRKGDGLFIRGARGTAAGRDGGGGARWERCCRCRERC